MALSLLPVSGDQAVNNRAIQEELGRLRRSGAFASAPGTPYAGQLWFDTTNNLLKYFNNSLSAVTLSTGGGTVTSLTEGTGIDLTPNTITTTGSIAVDTSVIATRAYVDSSVVGLLDFKGSTDCSANPNYPSASKGDAYVVSVAGKIGGASGKSVDVGDVYIATADNAGGTEASVGTNWTVLEHNLTGALLAANNLSDVASASTARTNLGLAIGTNVQAQNDILQDLAGLTQAANKLPYFDSSTTAATTDLTSFGRSLIDDANAAAAISTLGLDADIATLSLPASTTITTFGASLIDDANAAAAISTLGLDADLATLSLPASTTISTFGASLIDDAAASNARTTLGLGTIATEAEANYALLAGRSGGQILYGGSGTTEDLILGSTAHVTKGNVRSLDNFLVGTAASQVSGRQFTLADTASPTASVSAGGMSVQRAGETGYHMKNRTSGAEGYFGTRIGGFFIGTDTNHAVAFMVNQSEKMTLTTQGNLGINNNNPASGIDLYNSMSWKQTVVSTATYTALDTDFTINMTNTGARTLSLPAASTRTGRVYMIVDGAGTAAASNITIDPNGAELINGSATATINKNRGAAMVYCDGTGWVIMFSPTTLTAGVSAADVSMANTYLIESANVSDITLTAATSFLTLNRLTIGSSQKFEIPSDTSLEIWDQKPTYPLMLGRATDATNVATTATTDATATVVPGLTKTITTQDGAIYRIRAGQNAYNSGANTTYLQIYYGTNTTGTKLVEQSLFHAVANARINLTAEYIGTLPQGAITINCYIKTSAGTSNFDGSSTGAKSFLTIERIE